MSLPRYEWAKLKPRLIAKIEADGLSLSELSRRTGMARPALRNLLDGTTANPQANTLRRLARVVEGDLEEGVEETAEIAGEVVTLTEESVAEVLTFFRSEDNPSMEHFLRSLLGSVRDPADRQRLVVNVLAQVKLSRISAGRPITQALLDLESKLLVPR